MSSLPLDIILNIFSRLPEETVLRFSSVSKYWCSLIKIHFYHATDTDLILGYEQGKSKVYSVDRRKSYLEAVKLEQPLNHAVSVFHEGKWSYLNWVHISNTCNGLLCIFRNPGSGIAIWNPCTKEFKKLPPPPLSHTMRSSKSVNFYGFGYDSSIDTYKVLRIVQYYEVFGRDCLGSVVMIYTLKTNSWRMIEKPNLYIVKDEATLVPNGILHWLASVRGRPYGLGSRLGNEVILSFDLKDEKFCELPGPMIAYGYSIESLGTLGGNLSLLTEHFRNLSDLWVMKDYGMKDSWTKLFSIPRQGVQIAIGERPNMHMRVLCLYKSGKVLLVYSEKHLLWYDPKLATFEVIRTHGLPGKFRAEPYVGSLVPLKSGYLSWKKTSNT